jgi:hypothetical protein
MPDMLLMSPILDLEEVLTAIRTIIWSNSNIDQDEQQQTDPLELGTKSSMWIESRTEQLKMNIERY